MSCAWSAVEFPSEFHGCVFLFWWVFLKWCKWALLLNYQIEHQWIDFEFWGHWILAPWTGSSWIRQLQVLTEGWSVCTCNRQQRGEGCLRQQWLEKQIKWFQSGIISCSLSNIQNNQIEISDGKCWRFPNGLGVITAIQVLLECRWFLTN